MNNFERINRLPPYVFAEVDELKINARRSGEDIIDFGMGNPDLPTPVSYTHLTLPTIYSV